MAENNLRDIKVFFSTSDKPVAADEMMEFWKSLTDEEKQYYKTEELV